MRNTCPECSTTLVVERRTMPFPGLSDVLVENVPVVVCSSSDCAYHAARWHRPGALSREIARQIAANPARLTPERLRFLRGTLGFSGKELADYANTTAESVSRWERGHRPHPQWMELLLRSWVLQMPDRDADPLEWLPHITADAPPALTVSAELAVMPAM
jgi:YgiT-type zinc finger domain-containing protein